MGVPVARADILLALCCALLGCRHEAAADESASRGPQRGDSVDDPNPSPAAATHENSEVVQAKRLPWVSLAGRPLPPTGSPVPVQPEAGPLRIAIDVRVARYGLVLRTAPTPSAPLRGRIPQGEAFEIFALVPGLGCEAPGWADVGHGAFACLASTVQSNTAAPRELPVLRDPGLAPFYYAQRRKDDAGRRWKSVTEFSQGAPHVDVLEPDHDYAFAIRRKVKGEFVLIDEQGRVVPEAEVTRHRPSRFEGRDLVERPVPPAHTLAWGVTWPQNPVFATPNEASAGLDPTPYQGELLLSPRPAVTDNDPWFALANGGFIHGRHLRHWHPPVPPVTFDEEEVWVDVELDQQVLTVMRGSTPIFVTLVSTGSKGPTPRGIFRISMKQAIGGMQSEPDSDDPYVVEAVPFVQYFAGDIALHGAFWHYRFGHKISHGCVNLAPKDARRVFAMTTPKLARGWSASYESDEHLGTTVRIHHRGEPVPDRREPVRILTSAAG